MNCINLSLKMVSLNKTDKKLEHSKLDYFIRKELI